MAWTKSPPELIAAFERLRPPAEGGVEHRKMFGYACCFVNGNLFVGLHQSSMMVRLDPSDRAEFLTLDGACLFEPMPGRAMKEYVAIPPQVMADEPELARWIERSLAYAGALPPKQPKRRKKKA
jgi:TfoX/Sxy family transcriptional regulator of competence genes